jgi:serine/threonine-protein kinase
MPVRFATEEFTPRERRALRSLLAQCGVTMADTLPLSVVPTPPARQGDALIGTRLNGFVVTGALSAGGMGVVYEAQHPIIGRRVAVKVVRPDLWADPDLCARFLREARAVSAVKHRNIVEILDFGALPDGAQYMMMEFLDGDTLAEVVARDAPLHPMHALQICEEVLSGLSAAHQVGVVHRDLKPANILMHRQTGGELIVKVLDFGLARQADNMPETPTRESILELSHERSSLLAGTPEYISPEQVGGEQVGPQGDLYSLGVILYEMLAGKLPFSSTSPFELMQMHRLSEPVPLRVLLPDVHPELDAFVMKLLAKSPAERPLGAKAAAQELVRLKAVFSTVEVPKVSRPRRSRPVAIGAALIAVGLLTLGMAAGRSSPSPSLSGPEMPRLESPRITLVPPPTPPPLIFAPPSPVAAVSVAPAPVPVHARARIAPALSPPSNSCESTDDWRRGIREQLGDLEKLALAKLRDDAPPSEVAKVKLRSRTLAGSARKASGGGCERVEAELRAWRASFK